MSERKKYVVTDDIQGLYAVAVEGDEDIHVASFLTEEDAVMIVRALNKTDDDTTLGDIIGMIGALLLFLGALCLLFWTPTVHGPLVLGGIVAPIGLLLILIGYLHQKSDRPTP